MGAVAVAVTGRAGVGVVGAGGRVVVVGEVRAADELVLADEHVVCRRQRVVAEVALAGPGPGGARQVALVGEGGMLGPDAGVEVAVDDALAGVGRCCRSSS